MTLTNQIRTAINNHTKQLYNHFFEYNLNTLTTYGQAPYKIIRKLEYALFYRQFVLLTYQDGTTEIGKLIGRSTSGRFILRNNNNKILHIVDLSDIFNIELA